MDSPRLLSALTHAWKKTRREKVVTPLGDPHPNGVSLSEMRRSFADVCNAPFEDSIMRYTDVFKIEDKKVMYIYDKRDRRTRDARRQLRKEDIASFKERMELSSLDQGARRLSRTIWLAAYIVDSMEKAFQSSASGDQLTPNLSELGVRMRTHDNNLALYSYFLFDKTKTFIQKLPTYFSLRLPESISLTSAGRRILDHPSEIYLSKEIMSILISKLQGHLKSPCSTIEPDISEYASRQIANQNQKRRDSERYALEKPDLVQVEWERCQSPSPSSSSLSSALSSASSASGWSPQVIESAPCDAGEAASAKDSSEITAGEIAELFVDNALSSMLVSKLADMVEQRLQSTGQVLTEPLLSLVARHSHMFLVFNNKQAVMLLKDVYESMFHAKECLGSGNVSSFNHAPMESRPSCFYGTALKYDHRSEKNVCVIRPKAMQPETVEVAPYKLFCPDPVWNSDNISSSCWKDTTCLMSSIASAEFEHVQMILSSL